MIDNIKNLIEIDEREVLRYLQYKDQDIGDSLSDEIKQCINKTREIINPRFIFRKYKIKKLKLSEEKSKVYLEGSNLTLQSDDVYNLLLECDECILMSATLGLEIEREIRKLTYTDLTKGIIIDACATTAIEEVCDIVQDDISKKSLKEDKYITYRYSPGYGDLAIEKNVDINNLLNSQKEIGLTVTNSGIMIPRKSVVALIGISHKGITNTKKSCENCSNRHNCDYKKETNGCEN
ncbi:vitamin B12 dependent-methionine synthase activation domain-containing protein [Terrisporobacter mayombei]|nr:vitamin B12 dependent-methionine synthase activation domain-containing protein [Terrisporobacter mayombei]